MGGGDEVDGAPENRHTEPGVRRWVRLRESTREQSYWTYWDRLSCTSVPCPDRCSSRREWAGVRAGSACCSGSDTVLSTAAPESQQERTDGKLQQTASCLTEVMWRTH